MLSRIEHPNASNTTSLSILNDDMNGNKYQNAQQPLQSQRTQLSLETDVTEDLNVEYPVQVNNIVKQSTNILHNNTKINQQQTNPEVQQNQDQIPQNTIQFQDTVINQAQHTNNLQIQYTQHDTQEDSVNTNDSISKEQKIIQNMFTNTTQNIDQDTNTQQISFQQNKSQQETASIVSKQQDISIQSHKQQQQCQNQDQQQFLLNIDDIQNIDVLQEDLNFIQRMYANQEDINDYAEQLIQCIEKESTLDFLIVFSSNQDITLVQQDDVNQQITFSKEQKVQVILQDPMDKEKDILIRIKDNLEDFQIQFADQDSLKKFQQMYSLWNSID